MALNLKKVKLRLDEPKIIYPNTRLVKKVFNWKPNTKFEIGLKKQLIFIKMHKFIYFFVKI